MRAAEKPAVQRSKLEALGTQMEQLKKETLKQDARRSA